MSIKKAIKLKYLRTLKFLLEDRKGVKIGRLIVALIGGIIPIILLYPFHVFHIKELYGMGAGISNFIIFDFLIGELKDGLAILVLFLSIVYSFIYPNVSIAILLTQIFLLVTFIINTKRSIKKVKTIRN